MPKTTKVERNKDLVLKRYSDPKKWGWGELGTVYSIHRQYAKDIFLRDMEKYLTIEEVKDYTKRIKML